MPAPKGNKIADKFKKLKELDLCQEAYKSYCDHLASGKMKESWYFDHPKLQMVWKTLQKHIREHPDVFPAVQAEIAYNKGYQKWEAVAAGSAEGEKKYEKANTASLQMIMRNKYGWDKKTEDEDTALKAKSNLETLADAIAGVRAKHLKKSKEDSSSQSE